MSNQSQSEGLCYLGWYKSEMCSERDSPLKRLYRWTHVKLTRLAGFGQLVWAAGCELSLALVHARRDIWDNASGGPAAYNAAARSHTSELTRGRFCFRVSTGGLRWRHRWAARVQVGREPARQKAREGYPSHYTSLYKYSADTLLVSSAACQISLWSDSCVCILLMILNFLAISIFSSLSKALIYCFSVKMLSYW